MFRCVIVLVLVAVQGTIQETVIQRVPSSKMANCPQIWCRDQDLIPDYCREETFVPGFDGTPCRTCDSIGAWCDKLSFDLLSNVEVCPPVGCLEQVLIPESCRESTYYLYRYLGSSGIGGEIVCQGCDKNNCTDPSFKADDCPKLNCSNKPIPAGCVDERKTILSDNHTICDACPSNRCQSNW